MCHNSRMRIFSPGNSLGRVAMHLAVTLCAMADIIQPAQAQSIGGWQIGSERLRDNQQQVASLTASNLLSGGNDGEYTPILKLSCIDGDTEHWKLELQLEEPLTSRGIITLWASYDGGNAVGQQWVVTGNKRSATLVSRSEVVRLSSAKRLKLQWNWGWSWLWLSDSANFELGDARTVVFTLAKNCAIPLPTGR